MDRKLRSQVPKLRRAEAGTAPAAACCVLVMLIWTVLGFLEVHANSPALVWVRPSVGSAYQVLNSPRNIIGGAIGEQGILTLGSDGVVSLTERKDNSSWFNPPRAATNAVAVSASGNFAGVLRADGRAVVWGTYARDLPSSLSNVVALAVGGDLTLALLSDGTVMSSSEPRLTGPITVPPGLRDVVAVSTSWTYNNSLALSADGTVTAWASRSSAADRVPKEATNIVVIAAGLRENFALRADGTVVGWGEGQDGRYHPDIASQFYPFAGVSNIVDLAAGPNRLLALTGDGRVLDSSGVDLGFTNALYLSPVDARGFVVLTGDGSPLVVNEPPNTFGVAGERVRLVAKVGGMRPLTMQWIKNGTPIPGATNSVLLLDDARPSDTGGYQLAVSNSQGSANSRVASLSVFEAAPVIRRSGIEPTGHTPFIGGAVTFFTEVSGSGPRSFQWQFRGAPIDGATNSRLSLTQLRRDQSGDYSVIVSNPLGTAASTPVRLQVSELVVWGNPDIQARGVPASATNLIAVSTSEAHTIALRADTTVVVWGNGDDEPGLAPPPGLSNDVAVVAAPGYNLALKADGRLTGWGWNFAALKISNVSNIVAIAAGHQFCLAVRSDGVLLAFGENEHARRVAAAGVHDVVAVAAYLGYGVALRSDGTVVNVGEETLLGPVPEGLSHARIIALGRSNAQALRSDGSLVQWGAIYDVNLIGQPEDLRDVIALANGGDHLLALRANGDVLGWGADGFRQASVPPDIHGVAALAAGYTHSMALVDDGPPRMIQHPLAVVGAFGNNARLVANAFGSSPLIYQWHLNGVPLIGATNAILALDRLSFLDAADYQVVVSNSHGAVTSRPASVTVNTSEPVGLSLQIEPATGRALLGGSAVLSASAQGTPPISYRWFFNDQPLFNGRDSTFRLDQLTFANAGDYAVRMVNPFGSSTSLSVRLSVVNVGVWGGSNGSSDDRVFDVPVEATNIVAVSASQRYVLALGQEGGAIGWGDARSGVLPVPVSATNLVSLAAGQEFGLGLRSDGTVLAWGDELNDYGILNLPASLTNVVQVAAGSSWAVALKADGTLVQWGDQQAGEMQPPPSGLFNVVQVSAGARHALALLKDGSVIGWGSGDCNEVHPALGLSNVVAVVAGDCYSMALRDNGTVVEWGTGKSVPPLDVTNLVAIAAGGYHRIGLREDGGIVSWGYEHGTLGQLRVPPELPSAVAIGAAGNASFAVIPATGKPHMARHPRPQTLFSGQRLRLESKVFPGAAAVTYHWLHDGVEVRSQTNAILDLASVSVADAGRYFVRASNPFGADTSHEVDVTVVAQAPIVLSEPVDVISYAGGSASFSVRVSGSEPLAFQWFLNDLALEGAVRPDLVIPSVDAQNAGGYSVVVSNGLGNVVSRTASLQVTPVVFLTRDDVPVDTQGHFVVRVRLSAPLDRDLRVRFEILRGHLPGPRNAQEAFIIVSAGSIEQCATIRDPALPWALARGWPSSLRLIEADFARVAAPAIADFVTARPDNSEPACGSTPPDRPAFSASGLQRRNDGSVELHFTAPEGASLLIEASNDFQHWWPVHGILAVGPSGREFWFIDQDPGSDGLRFYRIRD